MNAKIRYAADLLRNSYWFMPSMMMVGAVGLATLTLAADARWDPGGPSDSWLLRSLIYGGGPDGAADVLSAIGGSMITVAGVVFSITIVALTLAASQFGSHVLASFMADRGNQFVLGTFIATFLYSLIVLRTIRAGDEGAAVVPHLSVTVALGLAVLSLCVLVYFIHHVSVSIQVSDLIAVIAGELAEVVNSFDLQEERAGRPDPRPMPKHGEPRSIAAPATGYVEAMDLRRLVAIAQEHDVYIEMVRRPGQFLVRGRELARVWPSERVDDELTATLQGTVATGRVRTALQDIEFPISQLAEVAVRALSPAINDPFAATTCVDQLGAGLCLLSERALPAARREDEDGVTRIEIAAPLTFDGIVREAFDQIRQNASHHASVYIRMLETIEMVLEDVRVPERIDPLMLEAELIAEAARSKVEAGIDRADVEERFRRVTAAVRRARARLAAGSGAAGTLA